MRSAKDCKREKGKLREEKRREIPKATKKQREIERKMKPTKTNKKRKEMRGESVCMTR